MSYQPRLVVLMRSEPFVPLLESIVYTLQRERLFWAALNSRPDEQWVRKVGLLSRVGGILEHV